jgi:hypothetical protein
MMIAADSDHGAQPCVCIMLLSHLRAGESFLLPGQVVCVLKLLMS